MRWDVLLLALVLAGALARLFRRDQLRARAWRAGLLAEAGSLFDECERGVDALGFAVLRGRYRGHLFEVGLIADSVAVRRLPSLWLGVTLKAPIPGAVTVDLLARAHNTEFYSPADNLPDRHNPPADWPQHVQIKSDGAPLSLDSLGADARSFFSDQRAKELLVTPRGVRLVYQLDQARREEYLVLRSARYSTEGADPSLIEDLMVRALAVRAALVAGGVRLGNAA